MKTFRMSSTISVLAALVPIGFFAPMALAQQPVDEEPAVAPLAHPLGQAHNPPARRAVAKPTATSSDVPAPP